MLLFFKPQELIVFTTAVPLHSAFFLFKYLDMIKKADTLVAVYWAAHYEYLLYLSARVFVCGPTYQRTTRVPAGCQSPPAVVLPLYSRADGGPTAINRQRWLD